MIPGCRGLFDGAGNASRIPASTGCGSSSECYPGVGVGGRRGPTNNDVWNQGWAVAAGQPKGAPKSDQQLLTAKLATAELTALPAARFLGELPLVRRGDPQQMAFESKVTITPSSGDSHSEVD